MRRTHVDGGVLGLDEQRSTEELVSILARIRSAGGSSSALRASAANEPASPDSVLRHFLREEALMDGRAVMSDGHRFTQHSPLGELDRSLSADEILSIIERDPAATALDVTPSNFDGDALYPTRQHEPADLQSQLVAMQSECDRWRAKASVESLKAEDAEQALYDMTAKYEEAAIGQHLSEQDNLALQAQLEDAMEHIVTLKRDSSETIK